MSKQKLFVASIVKANVEQLAQIVGATQDPFVKQVVTQGLIYMNELENVISNVQPSGLTKAKVNTVAKLLPTLGVKFEILGQGEDTYVEIEAPAPKTQEATPDPKSEQDSEVSASPVEEVAAVKDACPNHDESDLAESTNDLTSSDDDNSEYDDGYADLKDDEEANENGTNA